MLNVVVGYDRRARVPAYVAAESILEHSSQPVNFTFLHRGTLGGLAGPVEQGHSTEFSTTRFLAPYLSGYTGWTLFIDNDVLVQADIAELFSHADSRYTVQCVQHDYTPKSGTKFLGKTQHVYKYKNWSSVMLFNCSRCTVLTPEYVKASSGLHLHQFGWIADHSGVGALPAGWNHLSGYGSTEGAKVIHYTDGGPWYRGKKGCQDGEKWMATWQRLMEVDI